MFGFLDIFWLFFGNLGFLFAPSLHPYISTANGYLYLRTPERPHHTTIQLSLIDQ